VGADKAVARTGRGTRRFGGSGPGVRVEAVVIAERPSLTFEVLLPTQQKVLAHLVGTVKRNFVRLVPGDRVEVELSPHDPTRGRISRKLEKE
jgi:translation initiation factor IF-1